MREEVLVLCGHKGLHDVFRDRLVGHEYAVLIGKLRNQGSIACMHPRRDRRFVLLELGNRRHVAAECGEIGPDRDQGDDAQHEERNRAPAGPFQGAGILLQGCAESRRRSVGHQLYLCGDSTAISHISPCSGGVCAGVRTRFRRYYGAPGPRKRGRCQMSWRSTSRSSSEISGRGRFSGLGVVRPSLSLAVI